MSIVSLVSGGLDSLLMAALVKESGSEQFPLFINYGQRAMAQELAACRQGLQRLQLPEPTVVNLSGYATVAKSGLTCAEMDVFVDAFTPGRNLLFLLTATAHAWTVRADVIAIGLLREDFALFPDQTSEFLNHSESVLRMAIGKPLSIVAPLMDFSKRDIVGLARAKNIVRSYSCHVGMEEPCGKCIACREFDFSQEN